MSFLTNAQMRDHLFKMKKANLYIRTMGIDVGRKYVGVAVSDYDLKKGEPLTTYVLEDVIRGNSLSHFDVNAQLFKRIKNLVYKKKVKGIVVGYPLKDGQETAHCKYVREFV